MRDSISRVLKYCVTSVDDPYRCTTFVETYGAVAINLIGEALVETDSDVCKDLGCRDEQDFIKRQRKLISI